MKDNADIAQVRTELLEFFGNDRSMADNWLHTPLPALDGEAPFALMSSQQGRARLRGILDAMRCGDLA